MMTQVAVVLGTRAKNLRVSAWLGKDGHATAMFEMSDAQIHPTAIVDPKAELGAGTIIGPYCIVGSDVALGEGCWLQHHVTLAGPMRAGAKNKFYAYCSIGQQTQDLKYAGEPTYLEIGNENTFREFCTVNRSTKSDDKTRVGK